MQAYQLQAESDGLHGPMWAMMNVLQDEVPGVPL